MNIIFCCNPLNYNEVDLDYKEEYEISKNLGFDIGLINFEELVYYNNPIKAIKKVNCCSERQMAIYRGWMIKPELYDILYNALLNQKNIQLINTLDEYKHCHYLPESYNLIKDSSIETYWIYEKDIDKDFNNVKDILKIFGSNSVVIKDFVKSRKHEWNEACYIPNATDFDNSIKVIKKFIELQGEDLNEGIVIRKFVDFEFLSNHPVSNMPLSKEYRLFFLKNNLISTINYWDEAQYNNNTVIDNKFLEVAKTIKSNFFTMDIAQLKNGEWTIVELGDGQVSGLAQKANKEEFYKNILSILNK